MRLSQNSAALIASVLLSMFGFNTLDAMVWEFYWHPWREFAFGLWAWTPSLYSDVWLSYFLGGIVPLCAGMFLLGYCVSALKKTSFS